MSERKLGHIEKIEWVRDIPNADKICTYGILGWEVIDQKGKYKVNDLVCYVEIDSVLPDKPEYEFLRDRKFRVRTIKLRGAISQGLILPLDKNILPAMVKPGFEANTYIGKDVTDLLGITKYLSPSEREEFEQTERKLANEKNKLKKFMMRYSWFRKLFLSRKKKSGFPYWVSKTDEERIQNIPHVLEQFKDKEVYVTEKIDGQSVTFTGKMVPRFGGLLGQIIPMKKYQFVVCSRNLTTNDKNSIYWKMAKKYHIEKILRENPTVTIQAEQIGPKIQDNKYGLKDNEIRVFNIIDHEKNYHYNFDEIYEFCQKYGLRNVPYLRTSPLIAIGDTVQELVEFSKGKSVLADIPREGVVVRCIENGQKLMSWKCINPEFLLKYD